MSQSSSTFDFRIRLFSFQNFREDYCRFDMNLVENLEYVTNEAGCQEACRHVKGCNFFSYFKEEQVCKLQANQLDYRDCDLIHGTPTPSLQDCIEANELKWAPEGENKVTILKCFLSLRYDHM